MISPHSPSDPPDERDPDADIGDNLSGGDWPRLQQSKVAAVFADMGQLFQVFFRLFERVARDPSLASSVEALANNLVVSGADSCMPGVLPQPLAPPKGDPLAASETPADVAAPSDPRLDNPLMCPSCGRVFGNRGALASHAKICGKASKTNPLPKVVVPPTLPQGATSASHNTDKQGRMRIKNARFSLGRSYARQQVQVVEVAGGLAFYNTAGALVGVFSQGGEPLPVALPPANPRECPYCGRQFTNAGAMKTHARTCKKREEGVCDSGEESKKKELKCPHCERTFRNGGAWTSHVKSCSKKHAKIPKVPSENYALKTRQVATAPDTDALPAALTRQPFQLVVFDVNHLQVSLERKRFDNGDSSVVRRVRQEVLAPLDNAKVPYIAFYYASQNFSRLQRDQPEDPRHRWYVEKSTKRGGGSLAEPVYADVDAPLAGQVCGFLERHGSQISRLILGTGDKDDRVVAARAKQLGIFVEVVVVSEHCLSGELRKLADTVTVLS